MIIHGSGLLATAFRQHAITTVPGIVFARGVSDSGTTDEEAYHRELRLLATAASEAVDVGVPIVYFCGAPIYGTFDSPRFETDEIQPRTRYGRHQADAERSIRASGARYLIVRTPNVVGPGGHEHQLVPSLVRQVISGRVSVRQHASRDLLDVRDLVLLTQRLLENGLTDVVVNVASGISTPVEQIVRRIVELLAVETEIVSEPGGDDQRFDVSRLGSLIGPLPFQASYPYLVLDRYVPALAAGLR